MRRLPVTPGYFEEFGQALNDDGVAYLSDIEPGEQLRELAAGLGACVEPGVGMPDGIHDGHSYLVRPRNDGVGEVDRHGNVILSTTRLVFPLHTDAYNSPEPPRYVLLHRVDRTPDATESCVSDAWAVLDDLAQETVSTLSTAVFPSALGLRPLLEAVNGVRRVRFNVREIENWAASSETEVLAAAASAMQELADSLTARQSTFVIEPGDCLVLDNWRVCHGRSPIPADSERVLERIWVE